MHVACMIFSPSIMSSGGFVKAMYASLMSGAITANSEPFVADLTQVWSQSEVFVHVTLLLGFIQETSLTMVAVVWKVPCVAALVYAVLRKCWTPLTTCNAGKREIRRPTISCRCHLCRSHINTLQRTWKGKKFMY